MYLQEKSLQKLRELINVETEYRSGPQLVSFFNRLGFDDTYGQGFPSRWVYTDSRLQKINGSATLDKCIRELLAPVNFISRFSELDTLINDFNQYLAFDGWKVVRKGKEITFAKADEINFAEAEKATAEVKEDDFLSREFKDVSIDRLRLDSAITSILEGRFEEIKKCFKADAPLSVIFLSGSTLEGILLGIASSNPKTFNQAKSSPKDKEGKVKVFQDWTLGNFIDVAAETGYLKEDVKKFSHALRDFRNYIHPYLQMSSSFNPDEHTAKICLQVLKAAIFQLSNAIADTTKN